MTGGINKANIAVYNTITQALSALQDANIVEIRPPLGVRPGTCVNLCDLGSRCVRAAGLGSSFGYGVDRVDMDDVLAGLHNSFDK